MIVCPNYQFIFVKNHKVAGTSVEIWLSQLCGNDAIITEITPEDERIRREQGYPGPQNYDIPWNRFTLRDYLRFIIKQNFPRPIQNHDSLMRLKKYFPDYCNNFFSFCIERNPWDKAVSYYYSELYFRNQNSEDYTFSDFLDSRVAQISDWSQYTDDEDKIAVDFVARFEHLKSDLKEVCTRLGVQWDEMDSIPRAKTNYRKEKKPYREIINADQRNIIAKSCRREIDYFGYSF